MANIQNGNRIIHNNVGSFILSLLSTIIYKRNLGKSSSLSGIQFSEYVFLLGFSD